VKRLALLRHASAADGVPDAERPLDARGRAQADGLAARLPALGPAPAIALCSTARRARETWERIGAALVPAPALRLESGLYLATPAAIARTLAALDAAVPSALVIGHNPGLEALARALARGGEAARRLRAGLAPAALAIFELEVDDWLAVEAAPARLLAFEAP